MSIHGFIRMQAEEILSDWQDFAGACHPEADAVEVHALRASTEALLLETAETLARDDRADAGGEAGAAESSERHAAALLERGYSLDELITEFHELRASILRRWEAQLASVGASELDEIDRLNAALDRSLAVAVRSYSARLAQSRELLIGGLAHDLRNPLGAIHQSAEALSLTRGGDPGSAELLRLIRSCATRMEKLVAQMLDYTRIQLGEPLPVVPVHTDLAHLCRTIIGELQAFHPDCIIQPYLTGDLSGTWDAEGIERMLSNVIGNAVEHGRHDVPVSVRAWGEDDQILVSVRNEGSSIPPDEVAVIFDPFRRGTSGARRSRRVPERAGLGLFVARGIAEAHGGTIEVSSSEGGGTTFTVRLPRGPRWSPAPVAFRPVGLR